MKMEAPENIWEKIKDKPIAIKTSNEKKKTFILRYSVAGMAACAVIALSVVIAQQNNNFNQIITDSTNPNSSTAIAREDSIVWNNIAMDYVRIAGTFKEVTAQEWLSVYNVSIPADIEWNDYSFIYSVPKKEDDKIKRISGYISSKENESKWINVYISNNGNTYSLFSDKFKISEISGKEVALSKSDSVTWGHFSANDFNYSFEAHGISDDAIIKMIKDFIS